MDRINLQHVVKHGMTAFNRHLIDLYPFKNGYYWTMTINSFSSSSVSLEATIYEVDGEGERKEYFIFDEEDTNRGQLIECSVEVRGNRAWIGSFMNNTNIGIINIDDKQFVVGRSYKFNKKTAGYDELEVFEIMSVNKNDNCTEIHAYCWVR